MVERGQRFRFALEPRDAFGIAGERFGQNLDRDFAIELRVTRAIDLAHPAGTERCDDLVGPEPGTR